MTETEWFTFGGANIKGTPAMSADDVRDDLTILREAVDVLVVQEFKWKWYWRVARDQMKQVLTRGSVTQRWGASPGFLTGMSNPVRGAQAALWNRKKFKKIRTKVWLLMDEKPGISLARYIRAVLLKDRTTGLRFWVVTTHFVVGGDRKGDEWTRRSLLSRNIHTFESFLLMLKKTGHPIVGELDANIARDSEAYRLWAQTMQRLDAEFVGEHGVEYLFLIPGKKAQFRWRNARVIRPKPHGRLNTDHEARIVDLRPVFR